MRQALLSLHPLKGFYLLIILAYLLLYVTRHDHFLDWQLTSSITSTSFPVDTFSKGPFVLSFPGEKYQVEENFFGSEIQPVDQYLALLLAICWLGLGYALACVSSLKRFYFILANALLVVFVVNLELEELALWGMSADTKWLTILTIALIAGTGYAFHAFYSHTSLAVRTSIFVLIIGLLGAAISYASDKNVTYHLLAHGNSGFAVITFLFVVLVSEEIVFGILYVITQSPSKGNEKHFVLISLMYLGFVLLYFLKKAGIYDNTLALINPFFLLAASSVLALWSFQFKQDSFSKSLDTSLDIRHLLISLGLVAFGYLSSGFLGGNDPLYESFHYTITYAHLAMGGIFFIYIIANFVDALIAGHMVYRIAYKERNFPYATSKIVGLVGIAAFFFMSNKEPLELTQAAQFNFMGDMALSEEEFRLAEQYYLEGSIFGYNNHYSNYQLGLLAQARGDFAEAAERFRLSTRRFPTPQSFVNAAAMVPEGNSAEALAFLETGQLAFPNVGEVSTNLANRYAASGRSSQALEVLRQNRETGEWNMANAVNEWRVMLELKNREEALGDYSSGNNAVKANILSQFLGVQHLHPDTSLQVVGYNLHDLAFINNVSYISGARVPNTLYENGIGATYNQELQSNLKLARVFNHYLAGQMDQALQSLNGLIYQSDGQERGELLNLKGLIYLKHGILPEARQAFGEAHQETFQFAQLNEAITLLETGDFERAESAWTDLVKADSSYADYLENLQPVFSNSQVSGFIGIYYRWSEYTPEELLEKVIEMRLSAREIEVLWQKITKTLSLEWNEKRYRSFLNSFRQVIPQESMTRSQWELSVINESSTEAAEGVHPLDPVATVAKVRIMKLAEPLEAYQFLVDALSIVESVPIYHQELAFLSLELGLTDYAEESRAKLEKLLVPENYATFLQEYQARLEMLTTEF